MALTAMLGTPVATAPGTGRPRKQSPTYPQVGLNIGPAIGRPPGAATGTAPPAPGVAAVGGAPVNMMAPPTGLLAGQSAAKQGLAGPASDQWEGPVHQSQQGKAPPMAVAPWLSRNATPGSPTSVMAHQAGQGVPITPPGQPQAPVAPQMPQGDPSGGGGMPAIPPGQGNAPPNGMLSSFGPGNNLIGSQVNPWDDERTQEAMGMTDRAAGGVMNYRDAAFRGIRAEGDPSMDYLDASAIRSAGAGGPGNFTGIDNPLDFQAGRDTGRARTLAAEGLESLYSAPNRQALAQGALDQFVQDTEPEYQRRQQDVGRQAAALGRIGSGMTADDVMRLGRSRESEIVAESGRLARETAGQEMADRQARLDSALRTGGQFRGEDLGEAGFEQGLRGEARGERGDELDYGFGTADLGLRRAGVFDQLSGSQFGRGQSLRDEGRRERGDRLGYDETRFQRRRQQLGDASSLEDQRFGQGSQRRDELRGERDYQYGLDRDAQQDRVQQRLMEDDLLGRSEGRALDRARFGADVGYGTEPWRTTMAGANDLYGAGMDQVGAAGDAAEGGLLDTIVGGIGGLFGGGGKSGSQAGKQLAAPYASPTGGVARGQYQGEGWDLAPGDSYAPAPAGGVRMFDDTVPVQRPGAAAPPAARQARGRVAPRMGAPANPRYGNVPY